MVICTAYAFGKYSSYQIFHKIYALKTEGMGGTMQKAIGETDDKVRPENWHSLIALEKKGKTAVEYLVLALKDEDKWVRYAAADALGNIGDSCCVDPLIRSLQDHDQDVRLVTVEALGKLGDPKARSALLTVYTTDQGCIKIAADKALNQMKP